MNNDILRNIFLFCDIDSKINMTKAFPDVVFNYNKVKNSLKQSK